MSKWIFIGIVGISVAAIFVFNISCSEEVTLEYPFSEGMKVAAIGLKDCGLRGQDTVVRLGSGSVSNRELVLQLDGPLTDRIGIEWVDESKALILFDGQQESVSYFQPEAAGVSLILMAAGKEVSESIQ
jgi:hypothetical protein